MMVDFQTVCALHIVHLQVHFTFSDGGSLSVASATIYNGTGKEYCMIFTFLSFLLVSV